MNFNIEEIGRYDEYYWKNRNDNINKEQLTKEKIQEAIDKINERMQDERNLTEYKERLEELRKDSKVSEFIELEGISDKTDKQLKRVLTLGNSKKVKEYALLKNRYEKAEKYHKQLTKYNTEGNVFEEIIFNTFRSTIKGLKCEHEIWLYDGSFYEVPYVILRHTRYRRKKDEYQVIREGVKTFSYNRYICLGNREVARTNDWERFEREHNVLKIQEYYINKEYYEKMFYMFLYQGYSIEEACNMIEEEFNNNKEKVVKKEEKMPAMKRIRRIKGRH